MVNFQLVLTLTTLLAFPTTLLADDQCPGAAGVAYVYFNNDKNCNPNTPHTERRWNGFNDQPNFACWNLDAAKGTVGSVYKSKSDGRCAVRFYTDRNCKDYLAGHSISQEGCMALPPGAKSFDAGCNLPTPPCQE
ncbi:unnamed protein product [Cercospora beticola]|nr:unnamed protein product [Cercospora beticola]